MTGWNVIAGRWSMTPTGGPARAIVLERSVGTDIVFAPGETVIDFALVAPTTPVEQRPDLGIGMDDVTVKGRTVTLTVHSLGAKGTSAGHARLIDPTGRKIAGASIPPLAAPTDLTPHTAHVRLHNPASATGLNIRVALAGDTPEVTQANNAVPLRR